MRPGTKPTPTAILKMRGSPLARNRKDEVQPPPDLVIMPQWLGVNAKRVWKTIVPQLGAMGVLAKIDTNAIARYCDTFAHWRGLAKRLNESDADLGRTDILLYSKFECSLN